MCSWIKTEIAVHCECAHGIILWKLCTINEPSTDYPAHCSLYIDSSIQIQKVDKKCLLQTLFCEHFTLMFFLQHPSQNVYPFLASSLLCPIPHLILSSIAQLLVHTFISLMLILPILHLMSQFFAKKKTFYKHLTH